MRYLVPSVAQPWFKVEIYKPVEPGIFAERKGRSNKTRSSTPLRCAACRAAGAVAKPSLRPTFRDGSYCRGVTTIRATSQPAFLRWMPCWQRSDCRAMSNSDRGEEKPGAPLWRRVRQIKKNWMPMRAFGIRGVDHREVPWSMWD